MPNLNEMEFKDYHQKGTLYNSMLEPFIIEDYKLWSLGDEQLQKLRDAAQEKIRQLESVLNSLKKKVNDLTNRLGEQTARYRQALMEERARRMQVEKENARLKREKAGMVSLLRKHKIEWKENLFTERNER